MEQIDEVKDRVHQLLRQVDIWTQQTPSNTSTSGDMRLAQEVERQRQQLAERDERLAKEKEGASREVNELKG